MDLHEVTGRRSEYTAPALTEADTARDPVAQFARWLGEVTEDVAEPHAMVLATAGADGRPWSRNVLLRGVDAHGHLRWFTNRRSPKGRQLAENPWACVTFSWLAMHRQVHVAGNVEVLGDADSDEYWSGRPRHSQLASAASPQSQVVSDRAALEERWDALAEAVGDGPIGRPDHWGGYRLIPDHWEFWQGRASRRHDRLVYERRGERWELLRLAP